MSDQGRLAGWLETEWLRVQSAFGERGGGGSPVTVNHVVLLSGYIDGLWFDNCASGSQPLTAGAAAGKRYERSSILLFPTVLPTFSGRTSLCHKLLGFVREPKVLGIMKQLLVR